MRKRLLFPAVCLFLIVLSCGKDDDPADPERTYQDVEQSFSEIDISPGIHDVTLETTNSIVWDFRVIVPPASSSTKKALIFALHGASGGDPNAHKTTACYVEPGLAGLDAFIISPNAGLDEWYEASNQQKVLTLYSLALKFWPIDAAKVAVTGYSNGGNASWFYTETRPEFFSAGIAMASSYSTENPDGSGRKIDVPLYVIHGADDELFPIEDTEAWVNLSISAGSDIQFVVAPGLGHYVPCDYVTYLQDAASWLQETVW